MKDKKNGVSKTMNETKLTAAKLVGGASERKRADNDYYATPFYATKAILNEIPLCDDTILEPAAGEGHIVKILKEYYPYNEIIANDLVWRNSRFSLDGIDITGGVDFLTYSPDRKYDTIITNPPFKYAQQFVEKALSIANHYVIMFMKIQFLETVERQKLFQEYPPKYVYVFSHRVPAWMNGNETDEKGKPWASTVCYAWFVWEKGWYEEPVIRWL